jgi:ADP-L-glycero-D-manno-heptose 6-epimerase
MRYLVTGGTGFIGSNIVRHLLAEGHEVIITGRDDELRIPGFTGDVYPTFIGLDWSELGQIDAVFHCAAINDTTLLDRKEMFRVNVDGAKELITNAIKHGCRRIVYASSTAAYGDAPAPYKENGPMHPLNPYGESKKVLDEWAMGFAKKHPDTVIVGLRYCNVYGPGEGYKGKRASMVYQLAQQMLTGCPRIFRDGEQKRDYSYVKDVVHANMLALNAHQSCVLNCGSGKATTFNELVRILNGVLGVKRTPDYMDNPYAGRYQDHTECDMALAKKTINFVPQYDIQHGIQDYFATGELTKKY